MHDQPIQRHPEYRALHDENVLLLEELAHLLTEEHDLTHVLKPNLLALYQKKIGAWELRGLNSRIRTLRARRRLEMARAAINRDEAPDLAVIDGQLELEFLAWQQTLQEATGRLDAANHRLEHLLPDVEARELKKLYHALVKKLHPDLHPDPSEHERRLWLRVQTAYEHSDAEELRALALLVERPDADAPMSATLDALRRDREVLKRQIATLLQRIEQVESQPPFSLRAQLADEAWLTLRRQEIEADVLQLDAQCAVLEKQLQVLLPSISDGKLFGLN